MVLREALKRPSVGKCRQPYHIRLHCCRDYTRSLLLCTTVSVVRVVTGAMISSIGWLGGTFKGPEARTVSTRHWVQVLRQEGRGRFNSSSPCHISSCMQPATSEVQKKNQESCERFHAHRSSQQAGGFVVRTR